MIRRTPLMSAERPERIRQWHEGAYEAAKREGASGQTFDYLGRPSWFHRKSGPSPACRIFSERRVLAEVRTGDRVLDMGTGSGVNVILVASTAASVLAGDITPHAIAAARENAVRNDVSDLIEVRQSDVFADVDGEFDLIIFDPPFRWFAPRDAFEAATTDENYQAMTSFFESAKQHLSGNGRMLIFFGTSGDLDYVRNLFDRNGFTAELLAHESLSKDGWAVDYVTYRVTP